MRQEQRNAALDLLEQTLGELAGKGLDIDEDQLDELAWMDGLLIASAIGPERIEPHEWMAAIWDPAKNADEDEAALALMAVLDVRREQILHELRTDKHDYEVNCLGSLDEAKAMSRALEWTLGFVRGIQLRPGTWKAITLEQGRGCGLEALAPFIEVDGKPFFADKSAEELAALRKEAFPFLGEAVYEMYTFWRRQAADRKQASRPAVKIGRNQRCLCGSGKKFKHCCLN